MNREQMLNALEELVGVLQSLELEGPLLLRKNRLVDNISLLSRLIVANALKEGTQALEAASERLMQISGELDSQKADVEATAKNIEKTLSVLGAIAGVIRFI